MDKQMHKNSYTAVLMKNKQQLRKKSEKIFISRTNILVLKTDIKCKENREISKQKSRLPGEL